ncbi:Tryptophan synthase beta chain [Bienertia sinuspersici]
MLVFVLLLLFPDDAKVLWDDLRDRYSLGNGPRILEIKHAIADCKQRGRSVAMLHQFCLGLDSKKFGYVVSTLLMSDPLPTMNAAYAKIIADERKQSVFEAREVYSSVSVGFNATGTAFGRSWSIRSVVIVRNLVMIRTIVMIFMVFSNGGRGGRDLLVGRSAVGVGSQPQQARGDYCPTSSLVAAFSGCHILSVANYPQPQPGLEPVPSSLNGCLGLHLLALGSPVLVHWGCHRCWFSPRSTVVEQQLVAKMLLRH